MSEITTRRCAMCHKQLPLENFYCDPKGRYNSYCRDCQRIYDREYGRARFWKDGHKRKHRSKYMED